MTVEMEDMVRAGLHPDEDAIVQEALRIMWQERPSARIAVAVHRYQAEDLSVTRAAALAGVCFDRMKEVLAEQGIPLRLGPESKEEARGELAALEQMRL